MKIKTPFRAVAISLFSTSIVSGAWLPVSPGNNWSSRCLPGGSKVNTFHACFRAHPRLLKKLMDETNINGYLGPDAAHFVLLPPNDDGESSTGSDGGESGGLNTALILDDYTVDVSFYIDDRFAAPQDKCSRVTIYEKPSKVLKIYDMCGTEYMDLPRYLWM